MLHLFIKKYVIDDTNEKCNLDLKVPNSFKHDSDILHHCFWNFFVSTYILLMNEWMSENGLLCGAWHTVKNTIQPLNNNCVNWKNVPVIGQLTLWPRLLSSSATSWSTPSSRLTNHWSAGHIECLMTIWFSYFEKCFT